MSAAMQEVILKLKKDFPGITLDHDGQWRLSDVVERLRNDFPEVDFQHLHAGSSMRPDGGVLFLVGRDSSRHVLLIAEKKNQGTNDARAKEGKVKQAKGNAIERLGKNVIGLRAAMLRESIFPFACFGDGCDFADGSSILDRVVTIAMFGKLNHEYLHNQGLFNRGSFYFREAEWTTDEMAKNCHALAKKSVHYYFSKYGEELFRGEAAERPQ